MMSRREESGLKLFRMVSELLKTKLQTQVPLAKHTSAFTKGQWIRPILKLQISDTNLYSDQCSNTTMMCAQEWPSKNLVLFYYFLYYYSLQNAVRTSSCCPPTTQELLKTNGHVVMGKIKEPKAARKHL